MGKIILVLVAFVIVGCGGNPRLAEIPNGAHERHVDRGYRVAVEQLDDEERGMLNQFFVGWESTGGGDFPEGFTVGAAIDVQRQIYMSMWGPVEQNE